MSDNSSEQEPSIEEILSSIRQIISDEDEAPQEGDEEEQVEETAPIQDPIDDGADDVFDLSEDDLIEEPAPEPVFEPEPEIVMEDRVEPEATMIDEPSEAERRDALEEIRNAKKKEQPQNTVPSDILSSGAQAAALGSLSKLTKKMPINNSRSYDGVTLEDIVKEMLHPMLREWMDDNLPPMVERIVQKELEKLARRAFDE